MNRATNRWIVAQLLALAVCLMLAARSYPRGYSIFDHDISFLGHPRLNPAGWWIWSLGMGIAGVLLWPVAGDVSRHMKELTAQSPPLQRRLAWFGSTGMHGACIGLLALALIPQYPGLIVAHQCAGAVAFTGLYVAVWLFWWILLCGGSRSPGSVTRFVFIACWAPIGFLMAQGYRFLAYGEPGHQLLNKHESLLLRFSLWEWLLFLGALMAALALVIWIPRRSATR